MDTKSAIARIEEGRKSHLQPHVSPSQALAPEVKEELARPFSLSKGVAPLTDEVIEFKVGLFNTRTRLGHAFQAAGSYALPGDTSRIRHPLGSAERRAITPGGGGGLGPRLRPRKILHCPPGYEHGGRFTGRHLNNCGRKLFEPAVVERAADAANGPDAPEALRLARRMKPPKPGEGVARDIGKIGDIGDVVQVGRRASIPEVGPYNKTKVDASTLKAVSLVRKNRKSTIVVRRDGFVLSSNVGLDSLAKQKRNIDMDGGTIVAFGTKNSFGTQPVNALFNSSARSLAIVLPGDGHVLVTQKRTLTSAEKSAVNAVMREDGPEKILKLVATSKGAVLVSVVGVRDPGKQVLVRPAGGGPTRSVPVWVYNTFLQKNAPGREGRDIWVLAKDT